MAAVNGRVLANHIITLNTFGVLLRTWEGIPVPNPNHIKEFLRFFASISHGAIDRERGLRVGNLNGYTERVFASFQHRTDTTIRTISRRSWQLRTSGRVGDPVSTAYVSVRIPEVSVRLMPQLPLVRRLAVDAKAQDVVSWLLACACRRGW